MPTPNSGGMSHVAKHHINTAIPATSPRVASTIGADDISAMRAAASTVIATAPIETQYGGLNSRGSSGNVIRRSATKTAIATYKINPNDHANTAVIARKFRASSKTGSKVAASTATDCAPTINTNQSPLAHCVTGRSDLPSTATTGMTYPKISQLIPATPSRIAAVAHQPANARRVPSTPVPATKVKNPNERCTSAKSAAIASRCASRRHVLRTISTM